MKRLPYIWVVFLIVLPGLLFFFAKPVVGIERKSATEEFVIEDSSATFALAAYPRDIRSCALEACLMPREIVKLNDVQKISASQFRLLVSKYSKDEQLKIWNLTRYYGLIDTLITNNLTVADTDLRSFPKEIHKDALYFKLNHYDLLLNISKVKKGFNQSFEQLIKQYPSQAQKVFVKLLAYPELIDLLCNHMLLVAQLGNFYETKPEAMNIWLDTLNRDRIKQEADAFSGWKQKIKNDTLAMHEIGAEVQEYITGHGYNGDEYYNEDGPANGYSISASYPYWCGYPDWVESAGWFSYPYWKECGFYLQGGNVTWLTPPAVIFLKWHFQDVQHFYKYPYFTNLCIEYYCLSLIKMKPEEQALVQQWMADHKKYFAADFYTTSNKERADWLKEYGRFKQDFDRQVELGFLSEGQEDDFLVKHASAYPHLKLQLNKPASCPDATPKGRPKIFSKGKQHS